MITSLRLRDFRNYEDKSFAFDQRNVVFCGQNGIGKTNVLEAISILSVGKSWREQSPSDLIRTGQEQPAALINATDNQDNNYQVQIQPRSRKFLKNQKAISLKQYFGTIPTLLFAPEHLRLFSGAKRERQRFFDRFLYQISPNFREALSTCQKATKQRNVILKQCQESFESSQVSIFQAQLNPWNKILSQAIPQVFAERQKLVTDITPLLQADLDLLSQKQDAVVLQLLKTEDYETTSEGVLEFFENNFTRERASGRTLIGPHRDDFAFFLREKPLLSSASRGEERSVMLSLLAAKKTLLQQALDKPPIMLLDDVFSELDQSRQDRLGQFCKDCQVFFTTTHTGHFKDFMDVQEILL